MSQEHQPTEPRPIGTLPPLAQVQAEAGIDPATGLPRHVGVAVAATVCFAVSALASGVALVLAWWGSIHMETFPTATRLVAWTRPRPGSLESVLLVTALAVAGLVMVGLPGLLAVNTWLGRGWVRWGALGGLAASALAALFTWQAWLGAPFSLAGLVLVWTPAARRWFATWRRVRRSGRAAAPAQVEDVQYGPVPLHM